LIALAAVVVAATAAGLAAHRRRGEPVERVTSLLLRVALYALFPLVAFFNIAALDFDAEVLAGVAYGWTSVAVAGLAAYLIATRVLHLPRPAVGALVLVGGFGNTGFLGLPFQSALFGREVLPEAVIYDVLVSGATLVTAGFSLGAAFGPVADLPRERVRAFFVRNPPLFATLAGLAAPDWLAPEWAVDASQLLVFAVVPLGFFAVGVTLSEAGTRGLPRLDAPTLTALGCKLALAPAVVLALSALVAPVADVFLVQPAMASALYAMVVANEYGLDRALTARAIAWSTAIVVTAGLAVTLV
jgi:predicted permease